MSLTSADFQPQDVLRPALPDSASPFTWSILGPSTERPVRSFYADLGCQFPHQTSIWQLVEGKPTLNDTALTQADLAAFSSALATSSSLGERLFGGGMDRRTAAVIRRVLDEAPASFAAVQRWHDRVRAMQWRQATILQIMEEIEPNAEAALSGQAVTLALAACGRQIAAWVAEWLPSAAGELLPGLLAGTEADTGAAAYRLALWQLEQAARQDQAAAAFLRQGDWQAELPAGDFQQAFDQFLKRYGRWAAIPLEAASPRWREEPAHLLAEIAARLTQSPSPAPVDPHAAAQARADAAARVSKQMGILRRRQFDPLFVQLQQLCDLANASYEAAVAVADTARYWALGAAREVVADGRLAEVEDVFLLELEELKQIMTGEWSSPEQVRPAVEARRARSR